MVFPVLMGIGLHTQFLYGVKNRSLILLIAEPDDVDIAVEFFCTAQKWYSLRQISGADILQTI